MQITICEPVPMWFFTDGDLDISLTFVEGNKSAEVELEKLSIQGLQYLIGSIQGGLVTTDVAHSVLIARLSKLINPDKPDVLTEPELTPEQKELQEKFLSSQARRMARAEASDRRCENLAQSTYKAIRSGLSGEENQYVIAKILELEKQGKRRKTVMKFLEDKLVSLRHRKIKRVNKSSLSQPENLSVEDRQEAMRYNTVKEGNIELVDFEETDIELIDFPVESIEILFEPEDPEDKVVGES